MEHGSLRRFYFLAERHTQKHGVEGNEFEPALEVRRFLHELRSELLRGQRR